MIYAIKMDKKKSGAPRTGKNEVWVNQLGDYSDRKRYFMALTKWKITNDITKRVLAELLAFCAMIALSGCDYLGEIGAHVAKTAGVDLTQEPTIVIAPGYKVSINGKLGSDSSRGWYSLGRRGRGRRDQGSESVFEVRSL